jgi:hypothetical protein
VYAFSSDARKAVATDLTWDQDAGITGKILKVGPSDFIDIPEQGAYNKAY